MLQGGYLKARGWGWWGGRWGADIVALRQEHPLSNERIEEGIRLDRTDIAFIDELKMLTKTMPRLGPPVQSCHGEQRVSTGARDPFL